jgi:hypothetical protein
MCTNTFDCSLKVGIPKLPIPVSQSTNNSHSPISWGLSSIYPAFLHQTLHPITSLKTPYLIHFIPYTFLCRNFESSLFSESKTTTPWLSSLPPSIPPPASSVVSVYQPANSLVFIFFPRFFKKNSFSLNSSSVLWDKGWSSLCTSSIS